jgi:hypothetical protein
LRLGFVPIKSDTIHHLLRPAENGLIARIHSFISRLSQLYLGGEDGAFDNVLRRELIHSHAELYKVMQLPATYLSVSSFRIHVSPLFALALDTNRITPYYTKILVSLTFHQTLVRNRY